MAGSPSLPPEGEPRRSHSTAVEVEVPPRAGARHPDHDRTHARFGHAGLLMGGGLLVMFVAGLAGFSDIGWMLGLITLMSGVVLLVETLEAERRRSKQDTKQDPR